ncbi:uncharacterized protein LOC121780230 [Salvia splendens]|uniref:uncharacterized protein LOC121780230 n=1 Tax=Salvia splendens TaxID=180675 RepID=UPI001C262570|nr:uncharacterized protein LOC121780230 [Salvia splendens]
MGGEHPEWLPADWEVRVKRRSSGKKDKYYIHPSIGLTFNSKPEVLRHLKDLKSSIKTSKHKEINKVNIKKAVAENLPPGWIKEIRRKKTRGKIRTDTYYTDPISGRLFRSMQEVYRHLKSKDSVEVESKPDDKGCTSMELVDHSPSSPAKAKGQRPVGKKGDKNMTGGERIKSGPDAAALKTIVKPLVEESCREDDSGTEKLQYKLPQENGNEQHNVGRRLRGRFVYNKLKLDTEGDALRSGSTIAAENNLNIPETNGSEQREKEKNHKEDSQQREDLARQNKNKNTKRKWMSNLPRRTSKRLAHLEANQPAEVKSSAKDEASARVSSKEEMDSIKNDGTSVQSNEPEMDTSVKIGTADSDKQCITENPTNDEQKETIPCENISPEKHKSTGAVCHKDQKDEKHLDASMKDLLMDPCIEFAIKTLTGAIPIEDLNKVDENPVSSLASTDQTPGCSSLFPCGDIWSDPCFEFAVKTLTGEMPSEDGVRFQISYKNPASSLPKIRVDSVCPSNYSDAKQRGV